MIQRLKQRFRQSEQGQPSAAAHLVSRQQFDETLRRERKRADRTGRTLAMVRFSAGCEASGKRALSYLRDVVLRQRLRETDVAGELAGHQVGVILPETDKRGAWVFVDAIRTQCDPHRQLQVRVYAYPAPGSPSPPGEFVEAEDQIEEIPGGCHALEPLLVQSLPVWKRSLDLVLTCLLAVLLAPLMLVTVVAIKLTSPGPILFRQWRSRRGGRPFMLYKFRTMCADAEKIRPDLRLRNEQDGPAFKIKDDPRVTSVGRYLRRTCIDELPQLWNVLRGEMTLVGPRPLPCHETDQCRGWERRRLEVTPGLTCIWQVDGGAKVSFAQWMRMDIRYIQSIGPGCDLRLLCRTLVKVALHRASH